MNWFKWFVIVDLLLIFGFFIADCVKNLNEDNPPPTQEVCTRSHIRKIPVTGLDGKTTLVPAERCDHYKIVENK